MRRGEVYWAVLAPRSGSEQTGRRPVVLLSNDGFNRIAAWRSVIVIPFSTSGRQAKRGPTAVLIPASFSGLSEDSVALCHQVTTLDRSKLSTKIGTLSATLMEAVEIGIKIALGLE